MKVLDKRVGGHKLTKKPTRTVAPIECSLWDSCAAAVLIKVNGSFGPKAMMAVLAESRHSLRCYITIRLTMTGYP